MGGKTYTKCKGGGGRRQYCNVLGHMLITSLEQCQGKCISGASCEMKDKTFNLSKGTEPWPSVNQFRR